MNDQDFTQTLIKTLSNPKIGWKDQKQILESLKEKIENGEQEMSNLVLKNGHLFASIIYNLRSAFVGLVS